MSVVIHKRKDSSSASTTTSKSTTGTSPTTTSIALKQHISVDVYFNSDAGDHQLLDGLAPSITFQQMFNMLIQKRRLDLVMDQDKSNYSLNLTRHSKRGDDMIPVIMEDTVGAATYAPFCRPIMVLKLLPPIPHQKVSSVFGNYLIYVVRNPLYGAVDSHNQPMPKFLNMCLTFLSKFGTMSEGIFRLSGSLYSVDALKKKIDEGTFLPIKPSEDPNVIAGIVKSFLRELAEPLLTYQLYEPFRCLFTEETVENDRVVKCRQLVHTLPIEHYAVLEHLIALCNKVAKHVDETKMNHETISIVVGPNIMIPPPDLQQVSADSMNTFQDTPIICNVASLMICNYTQIFKHTSPYDPTLLGLENLPPHEVLQLQLNSPKADVAKKKKAQYIRGHIPRSTYHSDKELPSEGVYTLNQSRIGLESLVVFTTYANSEDMTPLDRLYLDRDIPFDRITSIQLHESEIEINYLYQKIDTKIYITENDEEQNADIAPAFTRYNSSLQAFCQQLYDSQARFLAYIEKANQMPEVYGEIITKEELLQAKKLKQEKQKRELDNAFKLVPQSPSSVDYLPSPQAEDDFDSDSDDSVVFRQ